VVQGRGSYRCWRESTTVPGVFSRLDEGIKETRAILRAPYRGRGAVHAADQAGDNRGGVVRMEDGNRQGQLAEVPHKPPLAVAARNGDLDLQLLTEPRPGRTGSSGRAGSRMAGLSECEG